MESIGRTYPLRYNEHIERRHLELRELRLKYRLTQVELSKRLGIPVRTIVNWERGVRRPPEYVMCVVRTYLEQGFPYIPMDISCESIVRLRKERSLSQRQFSELIKVPLSTLCQWEQGKRKPPEYFISMLVVLMEQRII